MKQTFVEKYTGMKLTSEQFKELERLQEKDNFNECLTAALKFLAEIKIETPDTYEKGLAFFEKFTGVSQKKLDRITSYPAIQGAAYILSESLQRVNIYLNKTGGLTDPFQTRADVQPLRRKTGSQVKTGKVFAVMLDAMVESGIDFQAIYENSQKLGIRSEAYQSMINTTCQKLAEALVTNGAVKVKPSGWANKTYYASLKEDTDIIQNAKHTFLETLLDLKERPFLDLDTSPVRMPTLDPNLIATLTNVMQTVPHHDQSNRSM